ncbi:LysR family transcriptional regulator [Mesorhizobium sp. M0659]|uniref:LysR family transcriptional regulator n=1 Tax=Mesorhizobium sp. M0659 TaxID=2956980 RepID=UPI00333AD95A
MFDFEELRSFVAVAEYGGITPGARHLGLSKSIVSRRLTRLEQELGTQLLRRTTRGATLTEAGATFRDHSARVIAELEAAREAVSSDGELRGLLRLAAPLSFGSTLAPVMAEMVRAHPKLQFQVSFSDALVDLVGGGYDAAVRISMMPNSTLVARRIGQVEGRIVASPDYLAQHRTLESLDDLQHHDALLLGTSAWYVKYRGKVKKLHPHGRFQADSGLAILSAAVAGMGIAMLPDFLADHHISRGELVRLLPANEPPPTPLQVVRAGGGNTPRKVAVMTNFLIRHLAARHSAVDETVPAAP